MDGFHLTRAQLQALPNASEAIFRRGAAFTFDGTGFVRLVERVRGGRRNRQQQQQQQEQECQPEQEQEVIYAPSFDHAIKDPMADDIAIPSSARLVIFEGNYLALDEPPWRDAAALMDEIWFVSVDEQVARKRLASRHLQAGIVDTYDQGIQRADGSDLVNGRHILSKRVTVHEEIECVEDEGWKGGWLPGRVSSE
jgi:pantothenate kinase